MSTCEDRNMATIVHFEIPSDNIERSKKFYHELFGWKIDKWSGSDSTMEYWMITTTDDKDNEGYKVPSSEAFLRRQSLRNHYPKLL